jgi:hypothetical protein
MGATTPVCARSELAGPQRGRTRGTVTDLTASLTGARYRYVVEREHRVAPAGAGPPRW